MPKAAGVMFVTTEKQPRVLLLRRSAGDHIGKWCTPGGHAESGESSWDTAARETAEETGIKPAWYNVKSVHDTGDYALHVYPVPRPFRPELNHEHDGSQWSRRDQLPDLHPKLQMFLDAYLDSGGVV